MRMHIPVSRDDAYLSAERRDCTLLWSIFVPLTIRVFLNLQTITTCLLWTSIRLSSVHFWRGDVLQGKARHINLVHAPGVSAAGCPPSRLHFHQRCDTSSVTPRPHNLVLRMNGCDPSWPGELQKALSAMLLLAACPPADLAAADSYLAEAQSWIRQGRVASTILVKGAQAWWQLVSRSDSE